MKFMAVVCPAVTMLMLSACASGPSQDEVRQHLRAWRGQTDTALTSTFGYPQKTVDLQSGKKVYRTEIVVGDISLLSGRGEEGGGSGSGYSQRGGNTASFD